jgi:hypothetical protein
MKKNVAIKWAKALESGRYKQGFGALKDKDGAYCCLGVLCRVQGLTFRKDPADGEPAIFIGRNDFGNCEYEGNVLPDRVIKSAGLRNMNTAGDFKDENYAPVAVWKNDLRVYSDLISMNDDKLDFPTIASAIRKNYKYL